MDMKWNPIIDGDLSEIPKYTEFLFTVVDEDDGEPYTTLGEVRRRGGNLLAVVTCYGVCEAKNVKAWMELPEPFKPTPNKCFKCNHGKLQHDESSDNWFECELLKRDVPPNDNPNDCPLNG